MAKHAFFYNSEKGDRVYDADSFEHWLKKFFTSGVFQGDCQVMANGDMTVTVGAGYANVDGKVKFFESAQVLQLEVADASYNRIDTIVIERNDTERDVNIKIVPGGRAPSPVPASPIRENGVYQLVLAQIYVAAGATKIMQENITDTRTNTTICGVVAGAVEQYDFDQFKVQFDEWFAVIKEKLGEAPATNLQAQIDELSEALDGWSIRVVDERPAVQEDGVIYMVKKAGA